jgi:hypothetical protein
VKEKEEEATKELDLNSITEFTDARQIKIDFMLKLDKGGVSCYQEYF